MPTIKSINKIEEAKPQKGLWFDYYGEIFISVVPTNYKAHIRRKAEIEDNKHDNKMSQWHLEWQYEKIENTHGQSIGKARTFEIPFEIDGEKHIIDSVVERLAIEFQHSLGVSLEEMNARFIAHKKKGFIPYLVLDLTDYPLSDYLSINSKVVKKIWKWKDCEYMNADNLFADLSDCIVRFSRKISNNHISISKEHFLSNLLHLETELQIEFQKENIRRTEEELRTEERLKAQKQRQEEEYLYCLEYERKVQIDKKKNHPDFKYFRKCLEDKLISPLIENMEHEVLQFNYSENREDEDVLEKEYFYMSKESFFEISYVNVFNTMGPRAEFDYSKVTINRGGQGEHLFCIKYGKTEQIY